MQQPINPEITDHREVMAALAAERGWQRGIELGIGSGKLFHRLLSLGVEMIGVDIGHRIERRRIVEKMAERHPGLVRNVYWKSTTDAAAEIPDGWADFIFIDAGHSYEACAADIEHYLPKLAPGGWFGGHDYHQAFPGVIRAVNEAFGSDGFVLLDGWIWARKA